MVLSIFTILIVTPTIGVKMQDTYIFEKCILFCQCEMLLRPIGLLVAGLARRKEIVRKLSNNKNLHAIQCDITKEEDILNAFEWIDEHLGAIHILVNCAGVIRITNLTEGSTKLWREVFDTNVMGLCIATREAVRSMRKNNVDGHIVHLNSIAGHKVCPLPNVNVTAASKHSVTALTETLRQELNSIGCKIKISSISPGVTKSDAVDAAYMASGQRPPQELINWIKAAPSLESYDVADAVIYVLSTPSHVQIHELIIKPVGEII
ncbi:hypothetical protein RI129_004756 [Pyrocoelia pectoralis]|uniref:Dehydrogenase/reductase SDR family member 11 n=1 Tax=Pyrocoelia pectoralis TaxID=417401 RepID=A0AAN7ZJM6_9COLE